jgi:hypothetical protein
MYRDIERREVSGVQIPGNKIEPQCPFLDTLLLHTKVLSVTLLERIRF